MVYLQENGVMMKTNEALKNFYTELDSTYEGYIQMSNEVLKTFTQKPSWETVHEGDNFIYEACLFNGDRSITIRQINDKFAVVDKKLSDFPEKSEEWFFTTDKKIKIVQIWEAKKDKYCEDMKVLTPTFQLFAGFDKGAKS